MKKTLLIPTAVTGLAIANTASAGPTAETEADSRFVAVSKGKKLKEQKEKGQPHREHSAATTHRNPT